MSNQPNLNPLNRRAPVRPAASLASLTLLAVLLFASGVMLYVFLWETPALIEERKAKAFPTQSNAILENASQITLYSLEGEPTMSNLTKGEEARLSPTSTPGHFHGFPILGQTVLSAADRAQMASAIYGGFGKRRIFEAFCFNPHHGLRAVQGNRSVDLVICFGCMTLETYSAGAHGHAPIGHAPEKYFNRLLSDAGVPIGYKP